MVDGMIAALLVVLALFSVNIRAADIILNEYNAVDSNDFLGGGDASADANGGRSCDSYFGRVRGSTVATDLVEDRFPRPIGIWWLAPAWRR